MPSPPKDMMRPKCCLPTGCHDECVLILVPHDQIRALLTSAVADASLWNHFDKPRTSAAQGMYFCKSDLVAHLGGVVPRDNLPAYLKELAARNEKPEAFYQAVKDTFCCGPPTPTDKQDAGPGNPRGQPKLVSRYFLDEPAPPSWIRHLEKIHSKTSTFLDECMASLKRKACSFWESRHAHRHAHRHGASLPSTKRASSGSLPDHHTPNFVPPKPFDAEKMLNPDQVGKSRREE